MFIHVFVIVFFLGIFTGFIGLYAFLKSREKQPLRHCSPQEIEHLTEDFQKLFYQINQSKRSQG